MKIITNLDQGSTIEISQYELFVVEIAFDSTTNELLSGPSYQKVQNCEVIKQFFVPANPCILGSTGKMIYLMMATFPITSMLYWFFTAPNYLEEFNFRLIVTPFNS